MGASLTVGEFYYINKPTFLYKGILILQGSKVELQEYHPDGSTSVLYLDKEGNPHKLDMIKADELKLVS